jgi:hypothetical protein
MKNDISQLLIDIQKKSRITIDSIRDIKNLKEEIESATHKNLSYNTLRRLFGFLPQTMPSNTTLTILSNYLGFSSYSNYIHNKLNYDEWYFQQKILMIQLTNRIDTSVIEFIEVGLTNKNNIVAVANFISHLITEDDEEGLKFIFSTLSFKNLKDSECLKFSTIITFRLLTLHRHIALKFYRLLLPIDTFRNLVPLYYIDYTHLTDIYADVLELILEFTTTPSDIFFVNLMFFYRSYYSLSDVSNYNLIAVPHNFDNLHIVLKGRYFSYLILNSERVDKSLESIILKEFKKNNVSLLSQEVLMSLVIKEEYKLLSFIFEKYYEDLFESTSWSYKTSNSINLIGLANVNWCQKNYVSARRNLELVELDKVELGYFEYISMFYYLTQLKISASENDTKLNNFARFALQSSVVKTKFVRFEIEMKKYLL